MADKDAQIELKKRARRRLVGAVALALLAVIVLPMVMDDEPKSGSQDIQVRIPSRDSSQASVSTPEPTIRSGSAERAPVGESSKPASGSSMGAKPAASAESVIPPTDKPLAEESAGASSGPAPPAKPHVADPEAEAVRAAKEVQPTRPETASGEGARAQAILNASGQFIVQLGVFADPGNARKVQARVKAEGYNSYSEPIRTSSGVKTRVRAGPFADRNAAEQARDKLKRGGLDGIVAPKS